MRLERLLSNRGYCERSWAARFLREHAVTLDGVALSKPATDVLMSRDADGVPEPAGELRIDGELIDAGRVVLLMHKPAGLVCSHNPREGPSVYDLLPARLRARQPAVQTVGRLDKDTTGTLLLTDDGQLVQRWTSPRTGVEKVYRLEVAQDLRGDEPALLAAGTLMLHGESKPCRPATLTLAGPRTAELTLHEGRFHQVKRMLAAAGHEVVTLHRTRFGAVSADDLPPGMFTAVDLRVMDAPGGA